MGALASDRHSPLADCLAALEVGGQVAHAVHGLHQLPQVRLDLREQRPLRPAPLSLAPQNALSSPCPGPHLIHGSDLQAQLVHHRDKELGASVCACDFPDPRLRTPTPWFLCREGPGAAPPRPLLALAGGSHGPTPAPIPAARGLLGGNAGHVPRRPVTGRGLGADPQPPPRRTPRRFGSCAQGPHRDHVGDAAVQVAFVVLDGDGSVLLDPLHGQRAVQLREGSWLALTGQPGHSPGPLHLPSPSG